jgi:hypothetical protein
MVPKSLVAADVPVPEVVPPALWTINEIELSTVPVTVSVPLDVAATAFNESATTTATNDSIDLRNNIILLGVRTDLPFHLLQLRFQRCF